MVIPLLVRTIEGNLTTGLLGYRDQPTERFKLLERLGTSSSAVFVKRLP